MINTCINIFILLLVPFLMIGIIKKTKAFWAGRKGVSIWQPLWDFLRLMKKDAVYSETTSWVFKFAPVAGFAAILFAALFAPLATGSAIIHFPGIGGVPFAFVIFSYALGFGKFLSLLAALDTGSSFEGMGAAREACFSTIVEPAFFILLGSLAALTHFCCFESFKHILENAGAYGVIIIILAVVTLFIMLLMECCRVPVDDPTTHLELTMIHEVMILDNSGVDLGFITWGAGIKMLIFSSLIANLIIPASLGTLETVFAFLALLFIISVVIGTVESSMARFRMTHVFEFIFIMSITALIVMALVTYRIYGN